MTSPIRITPTLPPEAQKLVTAYENEYGFSGPGCNPAGLAAVLELLDKIGHSNLPPYDIDLQFYAQMLRGGIR